MKNTKRFIALLICITMLFATVSMSIDPIAASEVIFESGDGTKENPYVIKTAEQLQSVNNDLSASYILGDSIDLSSIDNWTPLGTNTAPFTGTFNGNGYIIYDVSINIHYDSNDFADHLPAVGFFGQTTGATITNLGIEDANYNISSDDSASERYSHVGGIAGTIQNTTIDSCYFKGTINNVVGNNVYSRAAGIASEGNNSTVSNCYSCSDIYAKSYNKNTMVAGLVAWMDYSVIIDKCYVIGSVTGENTTSYCYAGGANASANYLFSSGGTVKNSVFMLRTLIANGRIVYKNNIGNYSGNSNNKVLAYNSEAAQNQTTYENLGWNFNSVWVLNKDAVYPTLKVFQKFPDGYDFYEDSYNFINYKEKISEKYFTTMYEDAPGTVLYEEKKDAGKGGLCFGMAYTTAAIYNSLPDCSTIRTVDIDDGIDDVIEYKYCDNIREILNPDFPFIDYVSLLTIGDKTITLEDYIKYAFVYQWSIEVEEADADTENDIRDLFYTVKNLTDNNIIGVTITLGHYAIDADGNRKTDEKGNYYTDGAHGVLAVGYEGRDILIDDPNNKDSLERITINDDWSWSFSGGWTSDGINSETSVICYQTDYYRPYEILLTGKKTTSIYESNGENSNTETYVEGMEKVDADSTLVCIDTDKEIQLPTNAVKISDGAGTVSSDTDNNTTDMYWFKDTDEIELTDIYGSISFAGDDKILSVTADKITNLSGSIKDTSFGVSFESEKGKQCSLEYRLVGEEKDTSLVISGTMTDETVSLQNTDNGIQIEGLSEGTVTLLNDGSEVGTATFDDHDNSFEISAENNEILLKNNDSEHDYSILQYNEYGHWYVCSSEKCSEKKELTEHTPDHQGGATEEYAIRCTVCQYEIEAQLVNSTSCDCLCHTENAFLQFIWKIVNFFSKLFNMNPVCSCGDKHY